MDTIQDTSPAVSTLNGVGPAIQARLHVLGIETLNDLIHHFPRRHDDNSTITDIIDLHPGAKYTIAGTVEKLHSRRAWKRKMTITEAVVGDSTASVHVIWFNQPYITKTLHVDDEMLLTGTVKKTPSGLSMQSPLYEKGGKGSETTHTGRIVPQYPLTSGITQKQMRYFMKQALQQALPLEETLPSEIVQEYALLSRTDAIQQIHFPESNESFALAHDRLEFEELFIIQLYVQHSKSFMHGQKSAALPFHEKEIKTFVASLPFTLTDAQRKAAWDILQDMGKTTTMNRLLIGDVGSGKTVVAALAIYNAVQSGYTAVLMAPTEILAKQHYAYIQKLFANTPLSVELLTGSTKSVHRKTGATPLPLMTADVVIGTHALIQDGVTFERLGLTIVDEQHRFGVEQRKALKNHSGNSATMPHLLSMTATPIPRTLALTLYGDLDISVIDELPAGRKPIMTRLIPPQKRNDAHTFIREHIENGEQAFVICPLIEPSDHLGVKSVTQEFERLSQTIFPDLSIEMLHGKMKPAEKDAVMARMQTGDIQLLVATSVIEVGVDIPNATMMIIEGAERFGLAQLHQFRGRVGRSDMQSYCFLFTDSSTDTTVERLNALTKTDSGFELAELDLKLRGAGEVFGTNQTGFPETSMTHFDNVELIAKAQKAAIETVQQGWIDAHPQLQKKLNTFIATVHLE